MGHRTTRFGEEIRKARLAVPLTQIELAERLSIQQPAISAWENGNAFPTASSLVRLGEVLDVDVRELLLLIVDEQDDQAAPEPVG